MPVEGLEGNSRDSDEVHRLRGSVLLGTSSGQQQRRADTCCYADAQGSEDHRRQELCLQSNGPISGRSGQKGNSVRLPLAALTEAEDLAC